MLKISSENSMMDLEIDSKIAQQVNSMNVICLVRLSRSNICDKSVSTSNFKPAKIEFTISLQFMT